MRQSGRYDDQSADRTAAPVCTWFAPSKTVLWTALTEDVTQPEPVLKAWMGPGEEGSSMDTSSDSTRKSTMYEPCEDPEKHESERFRMMGGFDVDCVYFGRGQKR